MKYGFKYIFERYHSVRLFALQKASQSGLDSKEPMKYVYIFILIALIIDIEPHPLDDLSKKEIQIFKNTIQKSKEFPPTIRYSILSIKEPNKQEILSNKARRILKGSLFSQQKNTLYEVEVDTANSKILSILPKEGAQPPISSEDFERLSKIVRQDKGWIEAIKKRGFKNPGDLHTDGWAPGLLSPDEKNSNLRLMRAITYYKGKGDNLYSRPIEGLIVTVDLNSEKVYSIHDNEVITKAKGYNDYNDIRKENIKINPVYYEQKGKPNYTLDGQNLKWLNWNLRFNFHQMHALQLYRVQFKDKDTYRSILYKLSLAEMVVPYGDPDKNWSFRNAFDVGEYGLGGTVHSLVKGVDVPKHAKLFDVHLIDESGNPKTIKNGYAIYERGSGALWKHFSTENGTSKSLKTQELVLTFMTTVGNYDYGINYVFHMDGTIEVQASLTGILLAKGTELTEVPCEHECPAIVERNILAPPHQHFFNFRVDLDIDTFNKNSALEVNTLPIKDLQINPDLNAFEKVNSTLPSEKQATRDLDIPQNRMWKVISTTDTNTMNHPTGYGIMLGENSIPYLQKGSEILKRAAFIEHPIWFTKHKESEQCSAGTYPNQSKGGDGLPKFIEDDENLVDEDIVMWYTMGVTHHPRPEEWPIMSAHKAGFKLIPIHFFNKNPTLK